MTVLCQIRGCPFPPRARHDRSRHQLPDHGRGPPRRCWQYRDAAKLAGNGASGRSKARCARVPPSRPRTRIDPGDPLPKFGTSSARVLDRWAQCGDEPASHRTKASTSLSVGCQSAPGRSDKWRCCALRVPPRRWPETTTSDHPSPIDKSSGPVVCQVLCQSVAMSFLADSAGQAPLRTQRSAIWQSRSTGAMRMVRLNDGGHFFAYTVSKAAKAKRRWPRIFKDAGPVHLIVLHSTLVQDARIRCH